MKLNVFVEYRISVIPKISIIAYSTMYTFLRKQPELEIIPKRVYRDYGLLEMLKKNIRCLSQT